MALAPRLEEYLQAHPVRHQLVKHPHTVSSRQSAEATQLPPERLVKAVVLQDDERQLLMAVLPASRKVDLDALRSRIGRSLRLASEEELGARFDDCALGAVPPVGPAYGIETVWDDSVGGEHDVYFEAGDHETLVRVAAPDFIRLLGKAQHMPFSEPMRAAGARPLF
jgi:Ala-tRNA(Pro) deacylase